MHLTSQNQTHTHTQLEQLNDTQEQRMARTEGLVGLDLLLGAADDGEGGGAAAEGRQALRPGRRHQS